MDKKRVKKGVIKRPSDEAMEAEKKKVARAKVGEDKVETVSQVVEVPVESAGQQVVHTSQIIDNTNLEQPVFVNMKGEPVQLGPNTVIVYEQSGNPSNFSFGGMWTVDSAGRIVMAETIYDVKGEPEEENNFVQGTAEVATVEEPTATYQQYELASGGVEAAQEYEVAIMEQPEGAEAAGARAEATVTSEEQLAALGPQAVRWLNQKYDFVVRKLQLTYDAGVKLLHSPSGCMQCVYFTTPSMQLAFNAVPQFLCIETGIEFTSTIPTVGSSTPAQLKHTVTLFLAEDGNGKSVVVSAGISTLVDELSWLLETFKSCNPAWRQVRCVVADPTKCQQVLRGAFPAAHVTCSVWQAARAAARAADATAQREGLALCADELAAKCKAYALATLRSEHTAQQLLVMKRGIVGSGAGTVRLWEALTRTNGVINKLDSWLEAENYTNILHKGLERLVGKFAGVTADGRPMQPDEFVSCFFNVANQLEEERRNFALNRLRDTENLKQSPTDTITQYAYNLMSLYCAQDTENLKQSPTDTITQYAYNLMSLYCAQDTENLKQSPTDTITQYAYNLMSLYCSQDTENLKQSPTDTITQYAYNLMSLYCAQDTENLKQSPTDTITQYAYNLMSLYCAQDTENLKQSPTDTITQYAYNLMSLYCAQDTENLKQSPTDTITQYAYNLMSLYCAQDTENLKQSPTDTITQYAYNLMSHQTSLAQKCLDDRAGRRHSSAAICKYGTSTQECSCLFSKVFRLPCRHILMLTTELKVKTHIPFEPRWTVQHCLFGCEAGAPAPAPTAQGNNYMEQVVVEEAQHRQAIAQPQQIHQVSGVRQQQYVLAAPGQTAQPVSQVIFCNSGVGGVGGAPVITSVLPAGGAVLTPHHALHHT